MNTQHLVLVGLMGSGKSTVGRQCASRLGRSFVDLDELIVTRAAMPFEDLWRTGGEDRFRELEREAVVDVCAAPQPLVIACGGGTVVDADNRRRLRAAGTVVWLRAPTAVLVSRVGDDPSRPLLAGDPAGALARLSVARADAYRAAADAVVDTDQGDVGDVADAVLAAYEERRR
ncbi:MAG TPA: shikimate kinase [Acidimicrobiia bacterium]|nr:shikimate kinase [Acidimicrobiia bacterium]